MPQWSGLELARMFAETAKALAAQDSFGQTVDDVVALAVSVVPGAEAAGLSLARSGGVETPAATEDLVRACDAAQYETGEGPCLQAVREDRILVVDDMTVETRWPRFASRAAALGVGSMLACHLSSERGTVSALNLYARDKRAFDEASRAVAQIYAVHATVALESARLEGDLRAAVSTRQGIGQAVGIVMERRRLTAKQAFDLLVRTSQRLNVKLRELAEMVVRTGIDPAETGELARLAGGRANEPHQQPRTDPDRPGGSTAAMTKFAAAEAHERAAVLHEKQAVTMRTNAAEHERQAGEHRRAAESARAAAQAELGQLG